MDIDIPGTSVGLETVELRPPPVDRRGPLLMEPPPLVLHQLPPPPNLRYMMLDDSPLILIMMRRLLKLMKAHEDSRVLGATDEEIVSFEDLVISMQPPADVGAPFFGRPNLPARNSRGLLSLS